ncbi:hypothetical protein BDZ89DRAFT_1261168 [Hymenopellis radicata]|nr:hypothetical protein BDZ89DRAFT_1261168 [Hymenopellis radicata]
MTKALASLSQLGKQFKGLQEPLSSQKIRLSLLRKPTRKAAFLRCRLRRENQTFPDWEVSEKIEFSKRCKNQTFQDGIDSEKFDTPDVRKARILEAGSIVLIGSGGRRRRQPPHAKFPYKVQFIAPRDPLCELTVAIVQYALPRLGGFINQAPSSEVDDDQAAE